MYVYSESLVFDFGADGQMESYVTCRYIYLGPSTAEERTEDQEVDECNDQNAPEDVDWLLAQKMDERQQKRMMTTVSVMFPEGVPEYVRKWTLHLAETDWMNDACGSLL